MDQQVGTEKLIVSYLCPVVLDPVHTICFKAVLLNSILFFSYSYRLHKVTFVDFQSDTLKIQVNDYLKFKEHSVKLDMFCWADF